MEQDRAPQKRRGRPPKAVDRPKNASFTFRLLPDLREKLETSAAARSVSMSEEIERRLETSFQSANDPYIDTAIRMAAANCMVVQNITGKTIVDDYYTCTACAKAAATAIELVGSTAREAKDTPRNRAFIQVSGDQLGQMIGLFTKALLDGEPEASMAGLRHVIDEIVERRKEEIAESDRLHRQTLARLLRESAPSEQSPTPVPAPDPAPELFDPAEPEKETKPAAPKRARKAKV